MLSSIIAQRLTPLLSLPASLTGAAQRSPSPDMARWTDQQHVRMFVLSHLCGPMIGLALTGFLALLGFPPDYRMLGFTALVCLFWAYPVALARGVGYRLLSLASLQHLTLVILWASHGYGGLNSPFLLWLAVVPLLAFLYVAPDRRLWLVLVLMLAGNVAAFIACGRLLSPPFVDPDPLRWLALLSLLSASAYVSMMAIYLGRVLSSRDEMEQEAVRHRTVAAQLDRLASHMRHIGAAKAASVARIGRECQAPLQEIALSCRTMLDEEGEGGDAPDLRSIAEAARYLGALIEDVDHYARLESRIARSEPVRFDLNALFEAVIAQAPSLSRGAPPSPPVYLCTDRALLEQALVQVIRHLRYPNSDPALALRAVPAEAGQVVISIRKEEAAPRTALRAEPGTVQPRGGQPSGHGLNLILAGRICSLLGGSLSPDPSLPAGAGYRVTLPAAA